MKEDLQSNVNNENEDIIKMWEPLKFDIGLNYKYVKNNIFFKLISNLFYYIIVAPIIFLISESSAGTLNPSTNTLPESNLFSPHKISIVVVLPAPFGANKPYRDPFKILRLRPSRVGLVFPLYFFVNPSVKIAYLSGILHKFFKSPEY